MTVEVLVQEYQKLSEVEKEKFFSLVLGEDELSPEGKAEISRRWQAFKEGKIKPLDGHMVEEKLAKNMAYNYEVFPQAQDELDSSLLWYEEQGGKKLSQRFFDAYLQARELILEDPERHTIIFEEFRRVHLKKFPYKIIYAFEARTVYVIAIAHDKRNPDYWKDRIDG